MDRHYPFIWIDVIRSDQVIWIKMKKREKVKTWPGQQKTYVVFICEGFANLSCLRVLWNEVPMFRNKNHFYSFSICFFHHKKFINIKRIKITGIKHETNILRNSHWYKPLLNFYWRDLWRNKVYKREDCLNLLAVRLFAA